MTSPEDQVEILIKTLNADESKHEVDETTEYVRQRVQQVYDQIERFDPTSLFQSWTSSFRYSTRYYLTLKN